MTRDELLQRALERAEQIHAAGGFKDTPVVPREVPHNARADRNNRNFSGFLGLHRKGNRHGTQA